MRSSGEPTAGDDSAGCIQEASPLRAMILMVCSNAQFRWLDSMVGFDVAFDIAFDTEFDG